jgi:DNA-binding GntR family transcriptional regulator
MTQEQTPTAVGQSVYTVRPSRLFEQIVQRIVVQQIEESGALKPGDQLPAERALAQQFGASRTPVRPEETVRSKPPLLKE